MQTLWRDRRDCLKTVTAPRYDSGPLDRLVDARLSEQAIGLCGNFANRAGEEWLA